jgi:hypothetical protein
MKIQRIVVALEPAPRARTALAAAAASAARMEAELVGLFIEDVDLLHFAGLPFAREVGFPSAAWRSLDVGTMERSLRVLADEARRTMASIAERAPVRWSFRVARGSVTSELLAGAGEADLMLLLQERAPVIAICSAAVSAVRVVPEASGLARSLGGGLSIVLRGDDIHATAVWEREARALLAAQDPGACVRVARDTGALHALLRELRRPVSVRPEAADGAA